MPAVRTTTASWVSRSRSVTPCGEPRRASPRRAATPPSPPRVPRAARRDLRAGRTVRARVTAIAADNAANTTARAAACNTEGLMPKDTGLPRADAQYDFSRARRRRALARLSARLRRADDVNHILPFEEVVQALGRVGERRLGEQTIPLDSIVGTVDRSREFDRVVPADLAARARALGAHQPRAAEGPGDAADRRVPDRRHALRQGRPSPRVGGPRARPQGHQRVRDRGAHRRSARTTRSACATCR